MLPSNLLITTFVRGKIRPRYAPLSKETLQLVERLSVLFQNVIGQSKKALYEGLEKLENDGHYDYRLTRGLAVLLMRRCVFEASSPVDSKSARRLVFTLASEVGLPTTREKRGEIIRRVAEELKVTTEDLEKSLWSDFDENLKLKQFDRMDDEALIRYYNLGLTQTLLFKAVNVDFTVRRGSYKNIFRTIKRLGLMYFVETLGGDNYKISVEGPMALVKMTEKYGTSIAKLLPVILQSEYWKIRADILRRREGFPRVFTFELECGEVKGQIEAMSQYATESTQLFDSGIEEKFWRDFVAFGSGWTIRREPEPLVTSSGTVMIPDFSFEKDGAKVYFEVVGFWTTQYLEKKIEKLRQLSIPNMIIAVDKKLGASRRLSGLPADVIFFEKSVSLKPILDRLKKVEVDAFSKQLSKASQIQLKLEGDLVELKDISRQTDVPVEALKKHFEERPQSGYVGVGDQLISERLLKEIDAKLESLRTNKIMTLSEASNLIEGAGIKSPQTLLNLLGYGVRWHGIEPSKAEISK
jgi:predicted nuclease of restriction endonuclease-like RecB superfamily